MKKILSLLALTVTLISCGTAQPLDVINPESDYLYFYWKTCPYCMQVNEYMKENDTMSNYSIEKREIYGNVKNQQMFQAVTAALGIPEWTAWVPFLLNKKTNEYVIGTDPIKELLPPDPTSVESQEAWETSSISEDVPEEIVSEEETTESVDAETQEETTIPSVNE